mmetsp:Transcript_19234/g.48956  ORF Transcript_19234/g.48956 Transcript_19234/m.48956 type:complete len:102 (-) Transcript_19234:600-905(-)
MLAVVLVSQQDADELVKHVESLGKRRLRDGAVEAAGAAVCALQGLPGGSALLPLLRTMVSTDINGMPASLWQVLEAIKQDMAALGVMHEVSDEVVRSGALV